VQIGGDIMNAIAHDFGVYYLLNGESLCKERRTWGGYVIARPVPIFQVPIFHVMIKSLKNKGLQWFYESVSTAGIQSEHK